MTVVDFEQVRAARGLRIVFAGKVPSPWSQAALGLFDMKGIKYLAVPFREFAGPVREHTGSPNAPVVLYDDDPPRTGWAEILALAERLGGRASLVPDDPELAVRLYGLTHEILSEGGLAWSVRLLLIHAGLTTEGREGWPVPIATYLAPKYCYAPGRVPAARARAVAVLELLSRQLSRSKAAGHEYMLGAAPSALDIYTATGVNIIAPLPHALCPIPPQIRHALETLDAPVRAAVSAPLLRHRDLMVERHLPMPMRV